MHKKLFLKCYFKKPSKKTLAEVPGVARPFLFLFIRPTPSHTYTPTHTPTLLLPPPPPPGGYYLLKNCYYEDVFIFQV